MTRRVIQHDKRNIRHECWETRYVRPLRPVAYHYDLTLSETQCCDGSPSQFVYFVKSTVKTFNLSNSGALEEKEEKKEKRKKKEGRV